jgi:hypothetical protein
MPARRTGQTGQIGYQGRSHEAADCGSYRLIRKVEPSKWLVEWTAACDATNVLVGYRSSSGPTGRQSCTGFVPDTAENRALVAAAGLTICQANWSR